MRHSSGVRGSSHPVEAWTELQPSSGRKISHDRDQLVGEEPENRRMTLPKQVMVSRHGASRSGSNVPGSFELSVRMLGSKLFVNASRSV